MKLEEARDILKSEHGLTARCAHAIGKKPMTLYHFIAGRRMLRADDFLAMCEWLKRNKVRP